MAKSAGRTTSENEASQARPLSPEEAERAAAAFVPIWQLDDAPFSLGAHSADLESLSGPLTQPLALQLAPPPVIGAATLPLTDAPTVVTAPPADAAAEELSAATIRMAALHQPLPRRPTEPSLPSVIVAPSQSVPPPPMVAAEPSVIIEPTPAPPAAALPVAAPPARLREPRTDPPAGPASVPDYDVPRRRTPMVLGLVAAVSGVAILAGYLISSPTEAQPTGSAPTSTSITAPTVPAPAIPPPPPIVPPTENVASPPASAAAPAPPPPVPIPVVATPTPTPTTHSSPVVTAVPAPAPQPPSQPPPPDRTSSHSSSSGSKWTAVPSAPATPTPKKPTPKPPAPAPSSGGIVRDNPF